MQKCSFFNLTFVVVTLIFFLSFYLTSFGSRKDIIKLNERIVVFNAIQKTGSTSIGWLFKTLSRKLKFSFKRYSCQTFNASRQKSPVEQDRFRARVRRSKRPSMTVQEIHFVAFPVDAAAHPGYVTFLRDPVERFKSRYQWSRANPKTAKIQFRAQKFYEPIQVRNLSFGEWLNRDLESCVMNEDAACNMNEGETVDHPLSYICGQGDECVSFGSRTALQKAKYNVENFYVVVGTLERLRESLILMERKLPRFAKGIARLYRTEKSKDRVKNRSGKTQNLTEAAREKLKQLLSVEYELFDYVTGRLMTHFVK